MCHWSAVQWFRALGFRVLCCGQRERGSNGEAEGSRLSHENLGKHMSYGLNLGWWGSIGDDIGFGGAPIKGYIASLVQGLHVLTTRSHWSATRVAGLEVSEKHFLLSTNPDLLPRRP